MKNKYAWLVIFFVLPALALSACGTAATPTSAPSNWRPAGSVTMPDGGGWGNVTAALGIADQYLVNGELRNYNAGGFTPGDVVALANCPKDATTPCLRARVQDFADTKAEYEYKMSGFQKPITSERIDEVLNDGCFDINMLNGRGHNRAPVNPDGSLGDGLADGCNLYVAAKYSYMDGNGACIPAAGFIEMRTRLNELNLANVGSLVIIVSYIDVTQSDLSLCGR